MANASSPEAGTFERLEAAWLARGAWQQLAGLYREKAAQAARLPWRLELLARLAELLEAELGDPEGAAAVYGEMAQAGDEEALEEQLRLLRARGDRSGTWRALDLAVERARIREARCAALTRRGEAALEAGELASARADFTAVLSLEPGHLDALSGLARLLPADEPPAPLLSLEAALRNAPPGLAWDARLRLLARLADVRGDCTELSLRAWRALAGPHLVDAEATERLTQLLSGVGHEAELVPVLQARIARVPRGEGARGLRHSLVRALDALGREAEAVEALRDAVRAEPGNHEAWLELSDRAEAGARHAEYAWALEHAATSTVDPAGRALLWRRLGAFLERVPGKQSEAHACLDRADRLERAVRTGATVLGPLVSPPRPRAGAGEQPSEDRVPTAPRPPPPSPPKVFVDLTPVMPRRDAPEVTPVRPLPAGSLPAPGGFGALPDLAVGPEPTPIKPLSGGPPRFELEPAPVAQLARSSSRGDVAASQEPSAAPAPSSLPAGAGWGEMQGRTTGSSTPPGRSQSPEEPEAGAAPRGAAGEEDFRRPEEGLTTWPGAGWVDGLASERATTDPGLLPVPGLPAGERPPLEVQTDPGLSAVPRLLEDTRRGERPTAEIPTVVPSVTARAPGLPRQLLEPAEWHAHAEARARAGDGWLAALSREVARALEGVGGSPPEPPRWLMCEAERAQLVHPGLHGPVAELLSLCGAALVATALSDGLPPPAVPFKATSGPGAQAALEALAASVRLLGLPAPAPECMALAGPPFALAAGEGASTRLQVGALALQRVLPGGELRFFAGRALFTQHPLLRVLRLVTPEELDTLLSLLPDAVRGGRRLPAEARALRAHLPEQARAELRERLDVLGEPLPLDELAMAARHAANRAGLAACGGVGAAVLALRSKRALDEEVEALLRFAASDGWRELSAPWAPLSALPANGR